MLITCHTHVIHIEFGHARLCSVMDACVTCCSGQAFVHAWLDPGVLLLPSQLGGRPWQADRCGPRRPLWHASDVAQANWLGRCAGKRAAGPGIHMATCYTPVKPHVKHMSYTCLTHAIHMEYTWSTHCFRPCSVTLGHSRSWMLLATGGVIRQAIVSLLCCTFTCLQGFYHALPKNSVRIIFPKLPL